MKSPRAILMIVFSIVVGLGAVVLASRWLAEQAPLATAKVVVASTDIELGARIAPTMVKVADWPSANVPQGSFSDIKDLDARVVNTTVQRGEPLLENKLAPIGSKGGLSAVIGAGKRAMTVRVNDVVGVAGFALPGNFVDIVVNTDDDSIRQTDGRSRSVSKIVLEHILVLAVAQVASRDETKPKLVNAVTLEVTPEQAEVLDLARSVGNLSLVLRNQVDNTMLATTGATKPFMLGRGPELAFEEVKPAAPQAAPLPALPSPTVVEQAPPPAPEVNVIVVKKPKRSAAKRSDAVQKPASAPAAKSNKVEIIKGTSRSNEDL
jgi:pilus assembly protein CpaB